MWIGSQQMANAQVNESNVRDTRRRTDWKEERLNKLVYYTLKIK